jgi:CRP-like cAMP-binding protein
MSDGGDRARPPSPNLQADYDRARPGSQAEFWVGEAVVAWLRRSGPLSAAAAADVAALPGEIRAISRGHDVLRQRMDGAYIIVLKSGLLHGYRSRADGTIQIHSFVLPGQVAGLDALMLPGADGGICASADSRIGLIPLAKFRAVAERHPDLLAVLWRASLVAGGIAREWLMRNSLLDARGRMSHLFCEIFALSQAAGLARADGCAFPATQELLSRALGITSVHVNRTLQVLRDKAAVDLRGGFLHVADGPALMRFASFDPRYLCLDPSKGS